MYENVCYQKNYIAEFICRLDFASVVAELDTNIPKEVYKTVRKHFPIAEPQDIVGTELQINPVTGPTVNNVIKKQWLFWSRDKKRHCVIDSNSIIFSVSNYMYFDDLSEVISSIILAVFSINERIQGKRFGMRYINIIPMSGHADWIEPKFFQALAEHKDPRTIRVVTTSEYAIEDKDLNVKLIYGYSNPDYPAIMKSEDFTIDVDAYSQGIIYDEDIKTMLNNMHFEIQDCFEKMITPAFKTELGEIK